MIRNYVVLIGVIVLCLAVLSAADVTVETNTNMDMVGAGKVKMNQIQQIKGSRSHDQNTTILSDQMAAMAAMAGGKEVKNIQIVRLDKGIGWALNPGAKSFTEFSFEQMKTNFTQNRILNESNASLNQYEWKTDISKNIKTDKVLNVDCVGIKVVSVGVNTKNNKDSVFITVEQWFSDKKPGTDEFLDFTNKMAVAVGSDKGFLYQMKMNPMLSRFGSQFGVIAKEFESLKGVPLKKFLSVEGTINPMVAAMGGRKLDEATKAAMKKMGMALPGEVPEGGRHNLITLNSTVTRIENNPIDDSKFEVPEGYNKK